MGYGFCRVHTANKGQLVRQFLLDTHWLPQSFGIEVARRLVPLVDRMIALHCTLRAAPFGLSRLALVLYPILAYFYVYSRKVCGYRE